MNKGFSSNKYTDSAIIEMAIYYVNNKATIRKVSEVFKVPKSTVHILLTHNLRYISYPLYVCVTRRINYNKAMRAHNAGIASQQRKRENYNNDKILYKNL